MEPTQELMDVIYRRKVEQARRMTPEEKLFAAAELFDDACEITRAGIRHQFPDASEEEVEEMLRDRLELAERLERTPIRRGARK